jgi:outer membrane protein
MYPRRLISVVRLLPLWLGLAILVATLHALVLAQVSSSASSSQSTATPARPAQPEVVHLKDYSKPRSAFPNVLQPYKSQEIAPPNLGNSPRIDSLMKDGKIYLSVDDAVALALENNLDLDLAR